MLFVKLVHMEQFPLIILIQCARNHGGQTGKIRLLVCNAFHVLIREPKQRERKYNLSIRMVVEQKQRGKLLAIHPCVFQEPELPEILHGVGEQKAFFRFCSALHKGTYGRYSRTCILR